MRRLTVLLIVFGIAAGAGVWFGMGGNDREAAFSLLQRPHQDRYLFDYTGVLAHHEEGIQQYLHRLSARFKIEAVIVSVERLPASHTLQTMAVDLARNWGVGARHDGRGLLLLLVEDTRQVKLEIGYALEHVFTDAFSGYVSHMQLEPYYRAGDVGTGLVAVMELFEARAWLAGEQHYTPERVAQADRDLVSGGAGVTHALLKSEKIPATTGPRNPQPGARSPEEAWQIMLASWAGERSAVGTDVYTQMTRRAMGDVDKPDPRTLEWLGHWRTAEYQVRRDGDHAVIWFGAIDGWENSPFLFCNTDDGWKFDIVWQRRLIVMAQNPKWQVMQGPYPYVDLMQEAWQSTGKDLPLTEQELYRCADDTRISARITELEQVLADDSGNADATLELLQLGTRTNRRPNVVSALIKQAKQIAPNHPDTYKYAALYNVTALLQYRTALEEIERYIELRPNAAFGYNMKGFLLYRLGDYADSLHTLQKAVALDPDDVYPFVIMARDYAMLARQSKGSKARHVDQAFAMLGKARRVSKPDHRRITWLNLWLEQMLQAS